VVWRDDGEEIDSLTAGQPNGTRGKGVEMAAKTQVARLTDWLRQAPGAEAVTAVGFAVLPQGQP
jgi:hypothetical protein